VRRSTRLGFDDAKESYCTRVKKATFGWDRSCASWLLEGISYTALRLESGLYL
jgi:hypothetical protein